MSTDTREALAALMTEKELLAIVDQLIRDVAYNRPAAVAIGMAVGAAVEAEVRRRAAALATQPAQPSAQGEAVAWPFERAAEMLTAYAELVKATGRYAEEHYIPEIENVVAELRTLASAPAAPAKAVPLTGRDIESAMNLAPVDLPYLERCRWIAQRLNGRGIKAAP